MLLHIVILAGGEGKRMLSKTPKVLHTVAGKPMLTRVIETALALNPAAVHVIYGHGGEQIRQALAHLPVNWVYQEQQLGTGHAVLQALPHIPSEARILVLSGDVPLIQLSTLEALLEVSRDFRLVLLLAKPDDPTGLGRIKRDENGHIQKIIEEKDASPEEKQIREIYSGICCAAAGDFQRWLPELGRNNAQGEYYLTDVIALSVQEGTAVSSLTAKTALEIQGVNNRCQLEMLERSFQKQKAEALMMQGVTIADASRLDIRGDFQCGQDVFIDVNCVMTGSVRIGNHCVIEPNCCLKDVTLGDHVHIHANSVLEGCEISEHCHIGPFARLRPGTVLAQGCKIGNFVETKQAIFGESSKASHLSYLGDVVLGRDVNIGAGTITCNYDGVNKHKTEIGDGVFVGSDTQFVAPVRIGDNATIGAGSTIRKDVPPNELTLTISQQKTVTGWKRPRKIRE